MLTGFALAGWPGPPRGQEGVEGLTRVPLLRGPVGLCSAVWESPSDVFKPPKWRSRCPREPLLSGAPGATGFSWVPQRRAGPRTCLWCSVLRGVGSLTRCTGVAGVRTCGAWGRGWRARAQHGEQKEQPRGAGSMGRAGYQVPTARGGTRHSLGLCSLPCAPLQGGPSPPHPPWSGPAVAPGGPCAAGARARSGSAHLRRQARTHRMC